MSGAHLGYRKKKNSPHHSILVSCGKWTTAAVLLRCSGMHSPWLFGQHLVKLRGRLRTIHWEHQRELWTLVPSWQSGSGVSAVSRWVWAALVTQETGEVDRLLLLRPPRGFRKDEARSETDHFKRSHLFIFIKPFTMQYIKKLASQAFRTYLAENDISIRLWQIPVSLSRAEELGDGTGKNGSLCGVDGELSSWEYILRQIG